MILSINIRILYSNNSTIFTVQVAPKFYLSTLSQLYYVPLQPFDEHSLKIPKYNLNRSKCIINL